MPLTRSQKPSADAAATQDSAGSPPTQSSSKRQRKRPTLFEQGENPSPSTARNKRPNKRARAEGEPPEAAEASLPRQQKPASRGSRSQPPEAAEASQFAAEAQAGDIVYGEEAITGQGVEDEDVEPGETDDPCPEDEEAVAVGAGAVSDEGVSWEDFEAVASVRYRACLGDLTRHPLVASDSFMGIKVDEMVLLDVWGWVDDVVTDLAPRKVSVTSLTVVVYPNKQPKNERRQKTIKRDGYLAWGEFKQLAKQLDFESSDALNVDFDLVLSEQKEQVQQVQPPRVRAATATMLQERALPGVVATEQAASPMVLAIIDRWRCENRHCKNWLKTCWVPQLSTPPRFNNHHPVLSRQLSNWAEDVAEGRCTVNEPSDRVRLALMTYKRERDNEEEKASKPLSVAEQLQQMQQMVLMQQLQQMQASSQQSPAQSSPTIARTVESIPSKPSQRAVTVAAGVPEIVAKEPLVWHPIECEHWLELHYHTRNFLRHFKLVWRHDIVDEIKEKVVKEARMDVNMLMESEGENGLGMGVWVNHFKLQPGDLLRLRQEVLVWQRQYKGLHQKQQEQVDRLVAAARIRRERGDVDDTSDDGVLTEL